jgi:hypothetical protein
VPGPYTDYTFEWYQGTDVFSSPVISADPILVGLPAGIYTVKVTHINSGCESVISAVVSDEIVIPFVNVQVISHQASCTEPNGSLVVIPAGEEPVGNYTFEWYEGPNVYFGPILSVSPTVDCLSAGIYTVVVTSKISGCQTIASAQVDLACESGSGFAMAAQGESATESQSANPNFSYYPNPTTGALWIKSEDASGYAVLMDKNGKIVRKQNFSPSGSPLAFDLADQPSGMYILTFTSGLHTSQHHIIKE